MPFEIPAGTQIEPGDYVATLEKVEEFESASYGTSRRWHWLVQVAPDKIESLATLTSANTGPRSTSYAYLTALLGRSPQAGEKIEDPTGQRVVLKIAKNEKGWPKIESAIPYADPQQVLEGVPR